MTENALALVKSETFATTVVDFYRNPKDIWMTREQIGTALEYAEPGIAIAKIHDRHKERLDALSSFVNVTKEEDGNQYIRESYLYSAKGVYEICRWSQQPKADAFFDWVYDRIEELRTGQKSWQGNNRRSSKAVDPVRLLRETRLSLPSGTNLWPVVRQIYQSLDIDLPEHLTTVPVSETSQSKAWPTQSPTIDLDLLRQTLQVAFDAVADRIVGWECNGPWVHDQHIGMVKILRGRRYLVCNQQWFKKALKPFRQIDTLRVLRDAGWLYADEAGHQFCRTARLEGGGSVRRMIWIDIKGADLRVSSGELERGES